MVPGTGGEIGRGFWTHGNSKMTGASPDMIAQLLYNEENLLKRYPTLTEAAGCEINVLEEIYCSNYMTAAEGAPEQDPTIWNDEFYMQDRLSNFTAYGPMIWNRFFDVIPPFLEDEYLDAVRGLPPEKRNRPHVHRAIIEKGAVRLSDLRLVPSGSRFSTLFDDGKPGFWDWKPLRKIQFRSYRKQPAQDYDGWLRAESDFVAGILNDSGLSLWDLFAQESVLKLFRDHLSGRNAGKMVCRIMTIALSEQSLRDA